MALDKAIEAVQAVRRMLRNTFYRPSSPRPDFRPVPVRGKVDVNQITRKSFGLRASEGYRTGAPAIE